MYGILVLNCNDVCAGMSVCIYRPLLNIDIAKQFPHPLYLNKVPMTSMLSHKGLFEYVQQAALRHFLSSSSSSVAPADGSTRKGAWSSANEMSPLSQLGDAEQLISALAFLHAA